MPALTCLEVALHAGVGIQCEDSSTLQSNQIISANDWFENLGSNVNVYADVEVVNSIIGGGGIFYGTTTTGITPRSMPDSTVFDYYIANGTDIPYGSISSGMIEKVVLSVDAERPEESVLAFAEAAPERFFLAANVNPGRHMKGCWGGYCE